MDAADAGEAECRAESMPFGRIEYKEDALYIDGAKFVFLSRIHLVHRYEVALFIVSEEGKLFLFDLASKSLLRSVMVCANDKFRFARVLGDKIYLVFDGSLHISPIDRIQFETVRLGAGIVDICAVGKDLYAISQQGKLFLNAKLLCSFLQVPLSMAYRNGSLHIACRNALAIVYNVATDKFTCEMTK